MKEQMKETVIVQSFNLLQKLKKIVERQQTQIDLLVEEVTNLKIQLNIHQHNNIDEITN